MKTPMTWVAVWLAASTAAAWEHLGGAWDIEDLPVGYEVAGDLAAGACSGHPAEVCLAELDAAWQAWQDVGTCSDFDGSYVGAAAYPGAVFGDGTNTVAFGEDVEPGVLAYAMLWADPGGAVVVRGEQTFERILEADIVVSNNVFATHDQATAPSCVGEISLREVLIHEIGHAAGLGHSCENGDPCDPQREAAVMYWSASWCDSDGPNADDDAGFEALYGPYAAFRCGGTDDDPILGVAPATLDCAITSSTLPWDTATWNLGDTTTATGGEVTHTWTHEGHYDVGLLVEGTHPSCGAWRTEAVRVGYLQLCSVPDAAFDVASDEAGVWELSNRTPTSVIGCVDSVRWTVHRGARADGPVVASGLNWDLTAELTGEGPWTAVLEVGGDAGVGRAETTFGGSPARAGCGCATATPTASWWVVGLLLTLGCRRTQAPAVRAPSEAFRCNTGATDRRGP